MTPIRSRGPSHSSISYPAVGRASRRVQFLDRGGYARLGLYVDHTVGVGYGFTIGAGDPNFTAVLVPAVQTNPFLLTFDDYGTLLAGGFAALSFVR